MNDKNDQTTSAAPTWGLANLAPEGAAAWGARAIPEAGRPAKHLEKRDGTRGRELRAAVPARLDIVWDRQGGAGGTEDERTALYAKLNGPEGMASAQAHYAALVARGEMPEGENVELVRTAELVVLACARGGYVYLGAWVPSPPRPVEIREGGGVSLTGEGIDLMRLVMLARGLMLPKGMKLSGKLPASTTIARRMGFKGNRDAQLKAVLARIEEIKQASGTSTTEVLAIHDSLSI